MKMGMFRKLFCRERRILHLLREKEKSQKGSKFANVIPGEFIIEIGSSTIPESRRELEYWIYSSR